MRPPRTVRFTGAPDPDIEADHPREDERPFAIQRRERRAQRRRDRLTQWVAQDIRLDGTSPPQRDVTEQGWREKITDDTLSKLPDDPLLGTKTFDGALKFHKKR